MWCEQTYGICLLEKRLGTMVYQLLSGVEQNVIHCEINISFSDFLQYPKDPCMVYLHIFTLMILNVGKYTSPTYLMEFTNSKYSPLYTSPTNLNQSHQSTAIYVKFSIVTTPGYHPDPSHPAHPHPHWWRFAVGRHRSGAR